MKKKIIISVVSAVAALVLGLVLVCAFMHPLDKLKLRMATADSYQIDIVIYDVPLIGTQTMIAKVDGDVKYTNGILFGAEAYTETVKGTDYKYSKNASGAWERAVAEESSSSDELIDFDTLLRMFDPDNYDKVDGEKNKYAQKADVEIAEDIKDVVITIEDDYFTIDAVGVKSILGFKLSLNMQAKVYNINKTEITLPDIE